MRKRVAFLIDATKPWGSNLLRGEQLCKIANWTLRDTGLTFGVQSFDADVEDAVLFCAKTALLSLSPDKVSQLRQKGNVLCADVLDSYLRGTDFSGYDFLVSSSNLQARYFKEKYPDKQVYNVTHHVDIRIPDIACNSDTYSAAFIGDLSTGFAIKEVSDLLAIIQSDPVNTRWIGELARHNLHYSVRAPSPGWDGFKPFTKGFIAAHFGAVVVVSKTDQEAMGHLGADYPFACDYALDSVRDILAFAKDNFGNGVWTQARQQMSLVRERSSPGVVTAELRALLNAAKVV